MSGQKLRYPASVIAEKTAIAPEEIRLLRQHMFPLGITSPEDAEQLLALHRSPVQKCVQWDGWFVESMAAFIVRDSHPKFSLDESNADWMIEIFALEGVIATGAELEALLHSMELARSVPDALAALALDQLRLALEFNRGAYASSRNVKRRGVAECDIDYLYRILRGSLVDGKMLLSECEVRVIDRIADLVVGKRNHPAWTSLRRSVAVRTSDGCASADRWLRMIETKDGLEIAA